MMRHSRCVPRLYRCSLLCSQMPNGAAFARYYRPNAAGPGGHRTVVTGIPSIVRTGSSWWEVSTTCGNWQTVYKRYRLWQDIGLWPQILAALDNEPR